MDVSASMATNAFPESRTDTAQSASAIALFLLRLGMGFNAHEIKLGVFGGAA